MGLIRHLHSSSRFDRSPESLQRAVTRYVRAHNLLTFTETQKRGRVEAALETPGWDVVKEYGPGDGDPAVMVKREDFKVLGKWVRQLTKHEQRRGPGGPPPPHALTVLVERRDNGQLILISVVHLPSNVEGNWFKRFHWRVFVWRRAVRGWKRHLRRVRRRQRRKNGRCPKTMLVADWNLNLERRVFRKLLRGLFPGLRCTWKRFPRGESTHHRRTIDGTVTNLRIVRAAEIFRDDPSSDHRPYDEVLD